MLSLLLFAGFTIFIFAPFELYMTNCNDFWFSIYDFGGYMIGAFIAYAVFSGLLILLSKDRKKILNVVSYILFLIVLDLYIQGNFLRTDFGQLDGQAVQWSNYSASMIISAVTMVLIIAGGVLLLLKSNDRTRVYKAASIISTCILLVQITTLLIVCISTNAFSNKESYVVTDKDEWKYSSTDNFIILITDAYDSRVFDELYKDGYQNQIESTFEDFTYYRNTVDTYSLTDFSVPQIITGSGYLNETRYGEYLNEAYEQSPLINDLYNKGYDLNVYTTISIPQGETADRINNWSKQRYGVSSHKRLLEHIYKLVGFRYLPQFLKPLCWTYTEAIDDLRTIDMDNDVYEWSNYYFRENLDKIEITSDKPSLHIIHLRGLHVPRNYDANFNEVSDQVDIWEAAKGVNLMLGEYINRLKDLGIYDNANIIILADHAANEYEELQFKQCPLLLVKGKNESHDYAISELPISYADLHTGFSNLSNGRTDNIFEVSDTERVRIHYESEWLERALNTEDFANQFVKYSTKGHAFDSNAFICE